LPYLTRHAVRIAATTAVFLIAVCLTASAQIFVKKISSDLGLGNPLAVNPLNPYVLYAATGHNKIYVSRDRGYSWSQFGASVAGTGSIKAIYVSPRDTQQVIVGIEVFPGEDRIYKSTDDGTTWTGTWVGTFNYFGKPVEFKVEHPDTVFTMGDSTIYRSIDFGSTWDTVVTFTGANKIDDWCDAELRRDSANIMFIGDNATGIWKTTNGGQNWRAVYETFGEIPSIAIDPFNPKHMFATNYGGGGGLLGSSDAGETWTNVSTPIGFGVGWWVTFSQTNPGYVYFCTYGGTPYGMFFSRDGGQTWTRIYKAQPPADSLNQFNYGMLVVDSLTVLALQDDGLYVLKYPAGVEPDGGEFLHVGAQTAITWKDSTSTTVRIDFSSNDGTNWTTLASGISTNLHTYAWSVPNAVSRTCRVRVVDEQHASFTDECDSDFTIYSTAFSLLSPTAGQTFLSGTQSAIQWNTQVAAPVEVDYSLDGGVHWLLAGDTVSAALGVYSGGFNWNVPSVSSNNCFVRVRVKTDSSVSVQSTSAFFISRCVESSFMIPPDSGWNMISIPVILPNASVNAVFSAAKTPAFIYANGYSAADRFVVGAGYWIKSPSTNITGCPVSVDTLGVVAGWNMIGSISYPIAVDSIRVIPAGLTLSNFFGYTRGYVADTVITPGAGYWVKASANGSIIFQKR
jgi:photosystem II stability/assembly factor-like uncharacterized protein